MYLDVSKNRIETVDLDISGCEGLEDLLLSSNMLQQLPDSIGEKSSGFLVIFYNRGFNLHLFLVLMRICNSWNKNCR